MRENVTILKQRVTLERPTFPVSLLLFQVPEPCLAAILDCRMIHGILRVLQETFLNDYLLEMDAPLPSSTIQRIWQPLLKNCDRTFLEIQSNRKLKNETSTAEFVNTCTALPKWRWNVQSYWWNSFSQWYDGLSEFSYIGLEFWKIS